MSQDQQAAEAAHKDLQDRIKKFNEKLIPILGEFKLGLGAQALLMPDGRISARPVLVDDSKPPEEKKEAAGLETADA